MCSSLSLLQINLMYSRYRKCKRPSGHHWPNLLKSGRQFSIQFIFSGYIVHYPDISENIFRGILGFFSMSVQNFITIVFLNELLYPSLGFSPLDFQSLREKSSTMKVFGVRSLKLETDKKLIVNTLYNQSFSLGGNVIMFVLHYCIQI